MKVLCSFLLVITIILSACEKDISLNLQSTPPQLVVNGWVTNVPANVPAPVHFSAIKYNTGFVVKLTTTANYYASDSTPPVSGAIVTITGSDSPSVTRVLSEIPASGIYLGAPNTVGRAGVTYSLTVQYKGQTYTAQDLLDSIPPIDSVQQTASTTGKSGYHLTYYTPNAGAHYYLLKFYKNDSLLNSNTNVEDASTQFVNPLIPELPAQSPYLYQSTDISRFEVYSISKTLYNYYNQLTQQLSAIGPGGGFATVFVTVPANVQGNVSNSALGFFQASMYWTRTDTVK